VVKQGAAAEQEDELQRLLRAVADEDRTVIMTSVNEAWAAQDSLLDLFLESFRSGERIAHFVDHLLVVALDGGALERCRAVHPHCYLLPTAAARNLSGEKVFMSKDYIDLVWSKVRLQQRILELGYNFLFTVPRTRRAVGHLDLGTTSTCSSLQNHPSDSNSCHDACRTWTFCGSGTRSSGCRWRRTW
jgi:hypothetical protein